MTGWKRYVVALLLTAMAVPVLAQRAPAREAVDTWVTVTASAAGTNKNAESEAVGFALRKAVEEACGTFIRGQSKV